MCNMYSIRFSRCLCALFIICKMFYPTLFFTIDVKALTPRIKSKTCFFIKIRKPLKMFHENVVDCWQIHRIIQTNKNSLVKLLSCCAKERLRAMALHQRIKIHHLKRNNKKSFSLLFCYNQSLIRTTFRAN